MRGYIKAAIFLILAVVLIPWKKKTFISPNDFKIVDPTTLTGAKAGDLIYFEGDVVAVPEVTPYYRRNRSYDKQIFDPRFLQEIPGDKFIAFETIVEMYQWVELRRRDSRGTSYTSQELDWESEHGTMQRRSKAKDNPPHPEVKEKRILAETLRAGKLIIKTENLYFPVPMGKELSIHAGMLAPGIAQKYFLADSKLYSTAAAAAGKPQIGDLRIYFKVAASPLKVSGFGEFNDHLHLVRWLEPKTGIEKRGLFSGSKPREEIIDLFFSERTWFWK